MSIRNTLRDLRFEMKMDQYVFVEFLGVSRTLYNKWEKNRGQPNLEMAMRIAKKTQRPVESFIVLIEDDSKE